MYRMGIMTFLLDGKSDLDRLKCMELGTWKKPKIKLLFLACVSFQHISHFNHIAALVHDLAESIVGDITPYCGVSKEDKKRREMEAMAEIAKLIAPRGERLMELFEVRFRLTFNHIYAFCLLSYLESSHIP